MIRITPALAGLALAALCAAACGTTTPNDGPDSGFGGGSGAGGGSGNSGACTATFTGGPGGTQSCFVAVAYDPTTNNTTIGFGLSNQSPLFAASLELGTGNVFADGTFTAANTLKDASSVFSGSSVWLMSEHASAQPDQGAISLSISSTGAPCNANNGNVVWLQPEGTLALTLEPQSSTGATGTVTANLEFSGSNLASTCISGSGGGAGGGSGGSDAGSGGGSGGADAGTQVVTLSGQITQSLSGLTPIVITQQGGAPDGGLRSSFTLESAGAYQGNSYSMSLSFALDAALATGTYDSSNSVSSSNYLLLDGGSVVGEWTEAYDDTPADTLGSLSVTLSSLSNDTTQGPTTYYAAHGSISGSLAQGDGGSVQVSGGF